MSSPSQANTFSFESSVISSRINTAFDVLYIYDYVITLDQEVKQIWTMKWTLLTWIFAINRYTALVLSLLAFVPVPNHTSCAWINGVERMLFLLQYIASAVFSSVRVYALGNRSVILLAVVSVLGAVPFVSNLVNFIKESLIFKLHGIPEGTSFCISILGLSGSKELRGVSAANRGSLIVADLVVLAVTLRKTLGTLRTASRLHMRVPLVATLVKDGSLFFLTLLTINIVVALNDNIQPDTAFRNLSSSLLQALPPILLSRFMLSLRQANANTIESRTGSRTQRSTIRFTSDVLIGNMGESLELGADSDLQDVRQDELDAEFESPRLDIEHHASTHGIGSSQEGMEYRV